MITLIEAKLKQKEEPPIAGADEVVKDQNSELKISIFEKEEATGEAENTSVTV